MPEPDHKIKHSLRTTVLIFFLLIVSVSFSQRKKQTVPVPAPDIPVVISAKKNKKEKTIEIYENDVLKYRLENEENVFGTWTVEKIYQKIYYLNGKLKSEGEFVVITSGKTWVVPIGKHVHFWKNGKYKVEAVFSDTGKLLSEKHYSRKGFLQRKDRVNE